jgi:hypothetical protein
MSLRTAVRVLPIAVLAAMALLAVGGAGTASARACASATYPGEGYFTQLRVRGTSCRAGRVVQLAHYRCRVRNGGRDGRCNRRVEGYRCREERGARTSVEYNARVTCRRTGRRISWFYQQNL